MDVDATTLFSDRVADYVAFRPRYPAGVFTYFKEELRVPLMGQVADLGSGTGIFAAQLVDAGYRVTAVEPNAEMRAAAENALGERPGFVSIAARAEATGLPAGTFDLVTAAQAFHWFDAGPAAAECRRILKPGGWVSLLWNIRREGDGALASFYDSEKEPLSCSMASMPQRSTRPSPRS